MAAVVASKVRKQRAALAKEADPAYQQQQKLKKQLAAAKIPVGANGVRQSQKKKSEGPRPNPAGNYEGGGGANVILYIGLGMVAMGLVITFVGLGDKGFRTLELKLIGPSLVGCGMFFALLRILFCTLPSCCSSCFKCCRSSEESEKLIKKEEERLKSQINIRKDRPRTPRNVVATPLSTFEKQPNQVRPKPHPHFVSDSEDEELGKVGSSLRRTKPQLTSSPSERNGPKAAEADTFSTTSSSTFSMNDLGGGDLVPRVPNLGGSTRKIKTGEMILNATKLNFETD